MAEASTRNEVITRTADGQKTIAFPIAVNGQVIGVMEFDVPEDRTISDEQVLVLQQVTDRLALTVENTRLFDDTRRVAQREAMVNSISTRIQSMTSVDAVLSTATRSLGDAIKANRVSVRLGTPPTELA
jgi:GAF domain-containing protein